LPWEPDALTSGSAATPSDQAVRADSEGRAAPELFRETDVEAEDVGHAPKARDQGAKPFEFLSMEYLTGVPKIEAIPLDSSDGFEFEPDPIEDHDSVQDDPLDPAEGDLRTFDGATQEAADSDDIDWVDEPKSPSFPADSEVLDPAGSDLGDALAASEPQAPAPPPEDLFVGPPVPMIRESDHLAELEAARAEIRESVWAEAHQAGIERGSAETRAALEAELADEREALAQLIRSIKDAATDPIALYAPVRKLATHLAIELVRGELSQSSDAIGRLIETCLAEIDRTPGDHLTLSLHPDDLERWVRRPAIALDRVELRSDPSIGPGSVRLSAGDTVIEDMLEHRLSVLATRVLGEGAAQQMPRLGQLRARGFAEGDISDVG
jgi:flagellar biosynthesis/type III secretory pathway protein FliH